MTRSVRPSLLPVLRLIGLLEAVNPFWLPAEVTWSASARVMLVKRLRLRGIAEFSGYRKFTVDTSTTYTNPPS